MINRSPQLEKGRYDEPVSILELAPTIAQIGGIKLDKTDGWPLQELKKRDFANRPLAFGRKLYGHDGWASLYHNRKYITRAGKEQIFDLEKDPLEKQNIAWKKEDILRGRVALQEGLQSKVVEGFRIVLNRRKSPLDVVVELDLPEGFLAYWAGSDPTNKGRLKVLTKENKLIGHWPKLQSGTREMFVIPKGDLVHAAQNLNMILKIQNKENKAARKFTLNRWPSHFPSRSTSLYISRLKGRVATLSYAITPLPIEGEELDGTNSEVSAELKALGYMED